MVRSGLRPSRYASMLGSPEGGFKLEHYLKTSYFLTCQRESVANYNIVYLPHKVHLIVYHLPEKYVYRTALFLGLYDEQQGAWVGQR